MGNGNRVLSEGDFNNMMNNKKIAQCLSGQLNVEDGESRGVREREMNNSTQLNFVSFPFLPSTSLVQVMKINEYIHKLE